jgi:hypothetical protein
VLGDEAGTIVRVGEIYDKFNKEREGYAILIENPDTV